LASAGLPGPAGEEAELALLNGVIIRVEPDEVAEALAVSGGRISSVGTNEEVQGSVGEGTRVVDLHGLTVLPGFVESHVHPLITGIAMLYWVDCSTPPNNSIEDVVRRLSEKARVTKEGEWIRGSRYDDTGIGDRRHLTRYDLDRVSRYHPVLVSHISGHLSYANSFALKQAGITKDTPDPRGGRIGRDMSGEPNGLLMEMGAQKSFASAYPVSHTEYMRALKAASEELLKVGVTSVHDTGVFGSLSEEEPGSSSGWRLYLSAYEESMRSGAFPVRVHALLRVDALDSFLSEGYKQTVSEEQLKMRAVKIVSDGSPQGHTAFFSQPYADQPENRGIQILTEDQLYALVSRAQEAGLQVGVHANGDGAIENVINAYERVLKEHPRKDHRLRIEHCQTVREDQLDRMAELGICASFFNLHVYYWGDRHRDRFLGEERARRISPLASALKKGVKFGLHSDWFVTPVNPIKNISVAVNRLTSSGKSLGPEQRISVRQAIRAVTIDAAYLGFDEKIKGSIEVGKLADFVVLSDNPLRVSPEEIDKISVKMTIIGGRVVYEGNGSAEEG